MSKYTQVVDANWDDRILFPESIPHLFHFDLLYLWMLEKDQDRRSRTWRERLEGWRYLASLFLLGELQLEEESIREPFLTYTRPFGIERVSWLTAPGADRLGVLSPTVLVRPLPDFAGAVLSRWRQMFGDLGRREPEIQHFVDLAVGRLRDGEGRGISSYRTRLAAVLERELGQTTLASQPAGRSVSIPVLRSLGWARPRLEAEGLALVDLLIREGGGDPRARVYVPRCASCNELLTRTQEESPIEVHGPSFEVICSCGHVNELALADFLIWYRGKGRVVVWRDDRQVPLEKGAPPPRTIQGIEVAMEWNPGRVGGSRQRFLRLVFQETTVREHRLEEIYFEKVVVPGRLEGFRGLPIRPEWIDILQNPDILPDVAPSVPRVVYRGGLQLGGWPVPVPKVLAESNLQVRDDLALGIYPDPAKVGPGWKWFRTFLDGPGRREFSVNCREATLVLPWIAEVKTGAPRLFSIEAASNPRIGVSFQVEPSSEIVAGLPTSSANLGVDFGTSNTLLAFHKVGLAGDRGKAETLKPEELLSTVKWLGPPASSWEGATADFLPPRSYRTSTDRSHLIPSALWLLPGRQASYLIRWDGRKPLPGATPLAGFKWEPEEGGSYKQERHAYLRELFLLALPAILSHMSRSRKITEVYLGFAFPLAFTQRARQGMLELLNDLKDDLLQLTGLSAQFGHISESAACVRAFGTPGHGDTYLIADMGGGTVDLVLFTAESEGKVDIHQIGSLRFAGEHFIQALASKKAGGSSSDELAWQLRDLIAEGNARSLYGRDSNASKILRRLVVFTLEFLRIMVLAHRKSHGDQEIRFVLVGNGWHLVDSLRERAEQIGAQSFFLEYYREYIQQLGEPNLSLYGKGPIEKLPSSKHLVVYGALANTIKNQRHDLNGEANPSKLPAGRTMTFNPPKRTPLTIDWHRIIGKDASVAITEASTTDLQNSYLDFALVSVPPLTAHWRAELIDTFEVADESAIPYPTKEKLREDVEIQGKRIERGPLQVILEECWREELSR